MGNQSCSFCFRPSNSRMIFAPLLLAVIFDLSTAHQCPKIITKAQPIGVYRFVKEVTFTPCFGKIAQCIYHAHHRFFCFSGKIKNLEATEVYPVYEQNPVQQDVCTGPFGNTLGTPFDFDTTFDPVKKWYMCPGNFLHRVVAQGLIVTKLNGENATAGDCNDLEYPPTKFHLGLGDYITDAFGRAGVVLDLLTLIVTPYEGEQSVHSVGGPHGSAFYAQPDPSQYGTCDLVNLKVTVTSWGDPTPGNFISSLEFCWVCLGVPVDFILY